MLVTLAFVPLDDIEKAFDEIIKYLPYNNIMSVVDYFEDNFTGRPMKRIKRKPKFEHCLWSIYNTTVHELVRINNGVAQWFIKPSWRTPCFYLKDV